MKLMIVESPNKIKKIKAILGSGWDVAASIGHIRDLPVKSLGVPTPTAREKLLHGTCNKFSTFAGTSASPSMQSLKT